VQQSLLILKKPNHHNKHGFSVYDLTATLVTYLNIFFKAIFSIFFLKKLKKQLSCKKYKKYPCGCRANHENTTHSSQKNRKQITTAHCCLKKPCSLIIVS